MRLLVVEDELTLQRQLVEALSANGYTVDVASDGREALYLGQEQAYDAVILDVGLPLMDGISVLRKWRADQRTMPVLILTARDDWHDKVSGIDAGADDYVTKPFHMQELLARVRALIRRASGVADATLRCGKLELDTRTGRVSCENEVIVLTSHEFKILSYLMHHLDEVVSRTDLTEHIYAQDFDRDSNTIEVMIGRLRKKLPDGLIQTIRGMGYRMSKADC
ncbi:response regulator transcription factor [Alcaligenaceae bacterium LF4-65]|jgi:two-component system OmpR family response regulator|uniref:Response regulator transcription factor n=1 Tax=Zwartia hollandica TaxID=324606 RepID=A0A953NBN2_9BURK|nr:response regulator transcription factor [Zwartia hollandica]MBZ1351553.1 response regulator transcription factor [Zwartia hollandica]